MNTLEFLVRKSQIAETQLRETPFSPLNAGQVRLAIGHFALTSNNITYAAFGDAMHYWDFYPVDDTWGQIPVWGFADVVESSLADVAVGERFYGYYPMSSHCVLTPVRQNASGFTDGAAHRSALHGVYNQYTRCSTDPFYTADSEAIQALLRPLFITSWLIDDFLADNQFFGAAEGGQKPVILLSSASSKTAYGTAYMLAQRSDIDVLGLTSASNVAFCNGLGCYRRVLTYEALDQIDADVPCIYVDFAGNAGLRKQIHTRFTNLRYSSSIGGTHVDQIGGASQLPGPRATLFFAPAQIKKRSAEWGQAGLGQRLLAGWQGFTRAATQAQTPWLTVASHTGAQAATEVYATVLAGRGDPRLGHMLSLR